VRRSEEDVADRVEDEREAIEGIEREVVAESGCE